MAEPTQQAPAFPKGPLLGAGGLILVALLAAVTGRLSGAEGLPPPGTIQVQRDLQFLDRDDGAVVVNDVGAHKQVAIMTGQNGFLRGTLRGMARTRRSEGVGPEAPFRLTGWADGRLTLMDPSTGRHIELEAFGSLNEAVFVKLLTEPETTL